MVGSVILHGKKRLWGQPNRHYHYAAIPERWIRGLRSRTELEEEIESFVARFA